MEAICQVIFYQPVEKADGIIHRFTKALTLPEQRFEPGDKIVIEIGSKENVSDGLIRLTERWQWFEIEGINLFSPLNGPMHARIRFKQWSITDDVRPVFEFLCQWGKINGGWEWKKLGD